MFEIKVTIEAPEIVGAINRLADAMTVTSASAQVKAPQKTSAPKKADPAEGKQKPVEAPVAPDPAPAPAPVVPDSTPAKNPEPVNEKKVLDIDTIARAGAGLIDAGKMPQIMELLKKYGVQAVTQLKTEQLESFAKDMKDLGADL